MKCLLLTLLAVAIAECQADEGYWLKFTAPSVKSEIFSPLRANKKKIVTEQCGKQVTDPYGELSHTFNLRETAPSQTNCTWYLHAPANHVVNVIAISFVLKDEIKPPLNDDIRVSTISIYDAAEPDQANLLTTYHVTPQEKVGHFVSSLSSKQDMVVEIKYHANKDFATQQMMIAYEFLDVDKMNALLRAN